MISVVASSAPLTVISFSIMFAWSTNTTTSVLALHIQTASSEGHILIIVTTIGVVMAIALNALVDLTPLSMLPFVLVEKGEALAARNSHGIVLTLAG